MGFFAALGRLLRPTPVPEDARDRLLEAWGLENSPPPPPRPAPTATPSPSVAKAVASDYDRDQWRRKLKTLLERLPDSRSLWNDFVADATALNLDPEWIRQAQREEFTLLLRRAVADRTITPEEQGNLELARSLIGLPEAEATGLLDQVIAEAETFFGKAIDRGVS